MFISGKSIIDFFRDLRPATFFLSRPPPSFLFLPDCASLFFLQSYCERLCREKICFYDFAFRFEKSLVFTTMKIHGLLFADGVVLFVSAPNLISTMRSIVFQVLVIVLSVDGEFPVS